MDCKECRRNLSAYAELLLEEELQQQVAAHLKECPDCRREANGLAQLLDRLVRDGESLESASLDKAALSQGATATADLASVHMVVRMRTLPRDNMAMIKLDHDFVPIELWKEFGERPRWRIESPGRTVVWDGQSGLALCRPNYAWKSGPSFHGPLGDLLDLHCLLMTEYLLAQEQGSELSLTHVQGEQGEPKLVVAVEATAQGDFTNDTMRNAYVEYSDNRRVYRFDARTRRLETFEVDVHAEAGDVRVLEVGRIDYEQQLDPALFSLEPPDDVIWMEEPRVMPDNEKYADMSPGEAARAFFQACADEDWAEVMKFWTVSRVDEDFSNYLGRLTLVDLGEPFQSGKYCGWFIPYEIRLRDGTTRTHNLAMRNDNPARRYVVDGGI
jgi:hypothetical protein